MSVDEQLRHDKIKFIDQQIEEYLYLIFKKLMPLKAQNNARGRLVLSMKNDMTSFITKVVCADREEFDKIVAEENKEKSHEVAKK